MSRNKILSQRQRREKRSDHKKYKRVIAAGITVVLAIATVVGLWPNSKGMTRFRAFLASPEPPVPIPSPGNPSKEYIYAAGKLVATEAPVTLIAPASMVATTLSNPLDPPAPRVSITWSATQGADHYQVEKTNNVNTAYTPVNTNVAGTSFTDTGVTTATAYLYRVRAVDVAGNVSAYSNYDLATAIAFTDDSLTIQSTAVKAAHMNELRQAVDAVRSLVNLAPMNWGGSITQFSSTVQATHILDLRSNLDAARSALNLPPCSYTETSLQQLQASFIKKDHIDQLRQCVR